MSSTDLSDCSIALPPPPPPPESQQASANKMFTTRVATLIGLSETNPKKLIEDLCVHSWKILTASGTGASQLDEGGEERVVLSLYQHCESVIQSGPTCGLVALMVCLKIVKPEFETNLADVLRQTQSLGYTKYGEMFSAENMCKLLQQVYGVRSECRHWLERSKLDVIEHLCLGLPLLLAYDADANYEPCLKAGGRAHWAAVCGFCLVTESVTPWSEQEGLCTVSSLPGKRTLVHVRPRQPQDQASNAIFKVIKDIAAKSSLFVYARQGKSRRLQVWPFEQLCRSNRNLSRVSNKILSDPERVKMVYPENGDLTKSLANQFIFIYK